MILALSGRIKSGKSTIASIIQLLIGNKKLSDENPLEKEMPNVFSQIDWRKGMFM